MKVTTAEFISSYADVAKCPTPDKPEFAFIGRSNVGKSSLINMLTNSRKLAKTSVTPGKTQTINHFLINLSWYLVDLPGYGYANVSKSTRADRKSTRLNSSHSQISYAVFCLKKKKILKE